MMSGSWRDLPRRLPEVSGVVSIIDSSIVVSSIVVGLRINGVKQKGVKEGLGVTNHL
jgi:hypothetical protein